MSGTGSEINDFNEGAVLPNEMTTATSSGEVVNDMKSSDMPPSMDNEVDAEAPALPEEQAGGKRHSKRSKSARRTKNKKSKSSKRKTNKRKSSKRKTNKRKNTRK